MLRIRAQVLSLLCSNERRQAIAKNLEECGVNWTFFDALTLLDDVGLKYNPQRAAANCGRQLSSSELGCFKSHYAILKTFSLDDASDWLIVFEDDIISDPQFDFEAFIGHLILNKIDMIRLHCRHWVAADTIGHYQHRQIIRAKTDPFGTQCYIINKQGACKLLSNISDIRRPIDDEIGRFWENGVPILALFPFPILESCMTSTIESSRNDQLIQKPNWLLRFARLRTRVSDKLGKTTHQLAAQFSIDLRLPRIFD